MQSFRVSTNIGLLILARAFGKQEIKVDKLSGDGVICWSLGKYYYFFGFFEQPIGGEGFEC